MERCLSIVDLFAGIGGLTLGAAKAAGELGYKFRVAGAVELQSPLADAYEVNFKRFDASVVRGSVTNNNVLQSFKNVRADLLTAGPPCQGNSDLNNHTRRNDERNALYEVVADYASMVNPKVILIENVQGVKHDKSGVVRKTLSKLENMGYVVQEAVVSAQDFGVPQTRRRHIVICTKKRIGDAIFENEKVGYRSTLRDYIADITDEWLVIDSIFTTPSKMGSRNLLRAEFLHRNGLFELPNSLRPDCHRTKIHSYTSMYGRLSWDKPAQTITSGFGSMGQGRYVHPSQARTITPHEAARLQGLPDFLKLDEIRSRVLLQEAIANVVPPPLVCALVKSIIRGGGFD